MGGVAMARQPQPRQHRGEWRAQLVRQRRQDVVLAAEGPEAGPRVAHGEAGHTRDRLGQGHRAVVVARVRLGGDERQGAERPGVGVQRDRDVAGQAEVGDEPLARRVVTWQQCGGGGRRLHLAFPGPHDARDSRSPGVGSPRSQQRGRPGLARGIGVHDGEPPARAEGVTDIDDAPVRQPGHQQRGHAAQRAPGVHRPRHGPGNLRE
jgi:hypothetical protein